MSGGPFGLDIHIRFFAISGLRHRRLCLSYLGFRKVPVRSSNDLRNTGLTDIRHGSSSQPPTFLCCCGLFMIVSPYGKVRLGGRTQGLQYTSTLGWLQCCLLPVMGIGLMFYGVQEPICPLLFLILPGQRRDARKLAATWRCCRRRRSRPARSRAWQDTISPWGLHPWGNYAVVALDWTLFSYNKGSAADHASRFYPIFGERILGLDRGTSSNPGGFATLFGTCHLAAAWREQAMLASTNLFGLPVSTTFPRFCLIVAHYRRCT